MCAALDELADFLAVLLTGSVSTAGREGRSSAAASLLDPWRQINNSEWRSGSAQV
jgi:hypothetical protein